MLPYWLGESQGRGRERNTRLVYEVARDGAAVEVSFDCL